MQRFVKITVEVLMDKNILDEKIKVLDKEFLKDAPNVNLILKETKKLLVEFPNNIKLMELRLSAYDYKGDRKNALKLCHEILKLDRNNTKAKGVLLYGDNFNMAKFDRNEAIESFIFKLFTNKKFLLALCFIFIGWYIYLHPSKETMNCDSNLKCTINHTYIGFINIKSELFLNKRSYIYPKDYVRTCHRYTHGICTHVVHIHISDKNGQLKSPFVYYYLGYDDDITDKSTEMMQREITSFYEYIKKPEKEFYLEAASGNALFIFTILGTIFVFLMYYLFNFIENIIKKIFCKKR